MPNFSVNTNKVKYDTFDGREIVFDVIAVFGDYLILTELKAIEILIQSGQIRGIVGWSMEEGIPEDGFNLIKKHDISLLG